VSTQEYSVGPLYLATEEAVSRFFRPHMAEITEMCEPYRTGKAIILPTGFHKLIAAGFWTRDIYDDIVLDFPNQWPDWMQSYEPDEDDTDPRWVSGAKFRPTSDGDEWGLKDLNDHIAKEAETRGTEES
jgi:hypothetical protein